MNQFLKYLIFVLVVVSINTSCVDRFEKIDKYIRPERLDGKIFTQISRQPNMKIFTQFMVDIGYDKILDKTGTYAVFVPSDSAMSIFLNSKYGTIDPSQIDSTVKADIVRYHILQMPWSKEQLQSLSSEGWIDINDISNNKPTAFKRRTLLKEPNKTYKIRRISSGNDAKEIIVPNSDPTSATRIVYNNEPKYVPLFFDGYMAAKGLSSEDYSFYFNRPYEAGELFYAGAKVVGEKTQFAENGFVYEIDRVVEPLPNAEQILENDAYSEFLQLIHNNSEFTFNNAATQAQEGASTGAEVDELYNLNYPQLNINIHEELVDNAKNTVELHNGILAPTNDALNDLLNNYLSKWGSTWNNVPQNIQLFVIKAHLATEAVYKKDFAEGFYNDNGDLLTGDDFETEDAMFGSNSTFISLKKAIVPKFFSSVAAPLFLDPRFSSHLIAYDQFKLLPTLKDNNNEFSFFAIEDRAFANDSTLFVSQSPGGRYMLTAYSFIDEGFVNLQGSEYRNIFKRRLFGQIGIQPVLGLANPEFVETLDGRHIIIQGDTISGGEPSETGFFSGRDTTFVFSELTDIPGITNGKVYMCGGWLNYRAANTYNFFRNTKFLSLLNKVGMASAVNERLTFLDPTERYTIFLPSDEALNAINVDTFALDDLRKLVTFHIVKGELIFTDGRQNQGAYRTFDNDFINLKPEPNNLIILDKENNIIYDKLVPSTRTNLLGTHTQDLGEMYYTSNALVHKIDTLILPY